MPLDGHLLHIEAFVFGHCHIVNILGQQTIKPKEGNI